MEGKKTWIVSWWMSHPDLDNDDCTTADSFDSLEAAKKAFYHHPDRWLRDHTTHIMLSVTELLEGEQLWEVPINTCERLDVRANPLARTPLDVSEGVYVDEDWRREIAREAGMLMGVQAYNEVMGYDVEG